MVIGARQCFQLFRQIIWFIENNRALPKFKYRILHYLINIIKSDQIKKKKKKKKLVLKSQFYINHASHLNKILQKIIFIKKSKVHDQPTVADKIINN